MNQVPNKVRGYEFDAYVKKQYGIWYIQKVIFNGPATIVLYVDKFGNERKVVTKCSEWDEYDPEKGLAIAFSKILLGDDFRKTFQKWMPEEELSLAESYFSELQKLVRKFKEQLGE